MPEKGLTPLSSSTTTPSWILFLRSNPLLHWRFHLLTALVFVGMAVVWSIDGCSIKTFLESWRFKKEYLLTMKLNSQSRPTNLAHQNFTVNITISHIPLTHDGNSTTGTGNYTNATKTAPLNYSVLNDNVSFQKNHSDGFLHEAEAEGNAKWVSTELEPNLTSTLIAQWLAPGGEPCRDSLTVEIVIPGLDDRDSIELTAADSHEFGFQAVDESKNPRCLGGDYFETDLSGESWKSRPLVRDFGNGSYSIFLQVHADFAGDYYLTVILLFRHFQGLRFSPPRFAYDKKLRRIPIKFVKGHTELPQLHDCQKSDFSRDIWVGRWTRHAKNDHCQISNDGRYRCLPPDFPCHSPWCNGSLGMIESNGWVYSSHCSFKLFSSYSAWNCLKNRWIFFWGDSNHVDTIRNMLNFLLDLPDIKSVPRRFDMNFSNPKDASQTVRITSIFNGHWNETQNYQGLNSLKDEGFRNLLKKYFSEDTVPDIIIMNSGLHDGVFWSNFRAFSVGANYAASFWKEVMDSVRRRGLVVPRIFYRTTVATGGYARTLAFNPNKMEAFNWVVLDKFRQAGLLAGVIDDFDMTFPWHFDNRCSDGVHYGRVPAKLKWRDGEIGHQYFVDLMLAHVLLNALCAR